MGKSIDDILREMEEKRIADASLRQENERKIAEVNEAARKDYIQRMRMYENSIFNSSTPSAGSGGGSLKNISNGYIADGYIADGYIGNQ
jgi:hypothetical protein